MEYSDYLGSLVDNKSFADCVFVAGEEEEEHREIYAHRVILARNDYFKAMFTSGLAESKVRDESTGQLMRIPMPNVRPQVLLCVLRWLYTAVYHHTSDDLFAELCVAADEYLCPTLRKKCERHLFMRRPIPDPSFFHLLAAWQGPQLDRKPGSATAQHIRATGIEKITTLLAMVGDLPPISKWTVKVLSRVILEASAADDKDTGCWAASVLQPFVERVILPVVQRKYNKTQLADVCQTVRKWKTDVRVTKTFQDRYELGQLLIRLSGPWSSLSEGTTRFCLKDGHLWMGYWLHRPMIAGRRGREPRFTRLEQSKVATLDELRELASSEAVDDGPLLTLQLRVCEFPSLTVLEKYIQGKLTDPKLSLVGLPSGFFPRLLRGGYQHLDEKLDANMLMHKVVDYLDAVQASAAKTSRSTNFKKFLHRIPWRFVDPDTLMHVASLKHTGMDASDWATVLKRLYTGEDDDVGTTNLNCKSKESNTPMLPVDLTSSILKLGAKKRKDVADPTDEPAAKRVRVTSDV